MADGRAVEVPPTDRSGVEVVGCGRALAESWVRVVDAEGRSLPEDRIGRIQVRGPSLMKGYHALPEKTAESIREGWLETGDQGYLRGGSLRVTGRLKDLVIIRGRNYVPSEFEWAAEEVPGVRKGNTVAFGARDAAQGTEVLHVACETDVTGEAAVELEAAITAKIADRTGVRPAKVYLLPRDSIPKTSSGKLQRSKLKDKLLG
jgi:fatty-acyl-CoA synthase